MDSDDKNHSLLQLSQLHRAPIVSQLVDIGSKRNQQEHSKLRSFISSLQCLRPNGSELHRQPINAFSQQQYVALSYTWTPSKHENPEPPEPGWYPVKNWDNEGLEPSSVRKCVLERVLRYMRHADVRFLWIDAHCIRQDTCGDDACIHHSRCSEKRDAIQAMDLVYQLSKHPVALLGRRLRSDTELHLLKLILSGQLIVGDHNSQYPREKTVHLAMQALSLLNEITQDSWWCRAWTFQENYRGGTRMQLLISHDNSLEQRKRQYLVFGKIPGELCIRSVTFSTEVTRLCLALREVKGLSSLDTQKIGAVLRATQRYKLTVNGSSSITPTVIADIQARGLSKPWDRLAIVANCCQYPVRLDGGALSRQDHSPSLSVLAMCLLNGEILDNGTKAREPVAELTTSGFLNSLTFQSFKPPEDDSRQLTFNKGCRLIDVELMMGGIATKGHIWELGWVIDTARFPENLPWINEPNGRLTLDQRRCLLQLVYHLDDLDSRYQGYYRYGWLARRISDYLAADANAGEHYTNFTDMYLHRMATELATAILARRKLRLGAICDDGQSAPYRAIFVWSKRDDDQPYPLPPAFVFTSVRQGDDGSEIYEANDIDYHVSLEVHIEPPTVSDGGVRRLRVHNGMLGLCDFEGCPRTRVVFPWPQSLLSIRP